nr:hypothetical protein B0A51_01073 [Rachicladosporium sp. CCFEE 5018]
MAAVNGATHDVANGTTKHTAASPTDAYKLPRDASESQRLDAQHTALQANIGFLLHPRIVETLPATDEVEIADIGTGTGTWLLELAAESKDKRFKFTGLDISAAQFPADPPNGMSFATHNMLSPVPSHLQARFDIIHVRFLVLGLPSGS